MPHTTVLKKEAVDELALFDHSVVVDATFGSGGHAAEICQRLGSKGVYIGIDADETAFTGSSFNPASYAPHVHLITGNFSNITTIIRSLHITSVNAVLADLGWRSEQFVSGGRGFSFTSDEPLEMTYGNPSEAHFTAHDIVNGWKEEDIANVLFGYGEERYARRIANAIVRERGTSPIMTASQLATIITRAVPPAYRRGRIHPATKSFQALRIAVNDELDVLTKLLADALLLLAPAGRLAIITFHSLEDRIVKHFFRDAVGRGEALHITKKPISPSATEVRTNPRSRSAKLRVIEKL